MKYFYLNDEHLKKGYPAVLLMSETKVNNYELEFLNSGIIVREYIGEYLPDRLVYDEKTKEVRVATEQEKYDLDPSNYVLREETYYIKSGEVKLKPAYHKDMLKPIFNLETETWEESATSQEIKYYKDEQYKAFYYSELENFGKATNEYNAGVMSEEEYGECRAYIRELASQLESSIKKSIERPSIMSKY